MATRYGCRMQRNPIRLVIAIAVFLAEAAVAQQVKPGDSPLVVSLDAADCRRLVAASDAAKTSHQPNADVTYRPGRDVDAGGRPIAPADLPGSNAANVLGPITLPLNLTLSDLLGSARVPRVGVSEVNVARVSIDPLSGKVAFNGQPLEQRGEDAVTTACRDYLAGQPKR